MFLYHGTSEEAALQILEHGLKPRIHHRRSNWKHTVESNLDAVYLTDAYPMYFAIHAIPEGQQRGAVLEIDIRKLDERLLVADEDVLEQAGRITNDRLPADWDMKSRTAYYRSQQKRFARKGFGYDMSLKAMGTCAYHGTIPVQAISRVAFFDAVACGPLSWAMLDPSITMMNYKFCAVKYRWLTKFLFKDHEPEPLLNDFEMAMFGDIIPELTHRFDHAKAITILNNPLYDAEMKVIRV